MPNWCHNKLTVEGPSVAVAAFVKKVATKEQPLTFAAHVPEPSAEVYAAIEESEKIECDLCGGTGKRPRTEGEAELIGARWVGTEYDRNQPEAVEERAACNGCRGSGRVVPFSGGQRGWVVSHWGTKWDASFGGPLGALGTEEADVAKSVAMQGVLIAPGMARYDFDTAWSPPVEWLLAVGPMEPELTLTLRYGEPGNDFAGEVAVHGHQVREAELTVEDVLSPEEMWF